MAFLLEQFEDDDDVDDGDVDERVESKTVVDDEDKSLIDDVPKMDEVGDGVVDCGQLV
jgi:hypothetical protein